METAFTVSYCLPTVQKACQNFRAISANKCGLTDLQPGSVPRLAVVLACAGAGAVVPLCRSIAPVALLGLAVVHANIQAAITNGDRLCDLSQVLFGYWFNNLPNPVAPSSASSQFGRMAAPAASSSRMLT